MKQRSSNVAKAVEPPPTRFRTAYTFNLQETDFEPVLGISQTIPNEAFSLHELIDRYGKGYPVNVLQPVYNEGDLADLRFLDPVDVHEYLLQYEGEVIDLRDKVEQENIARHAEMLAQQAAEALNATQKTPGGSTEPVPPPRS